MKLTDPKSIHRRKWLVGGLSVFGVIVLASTGFAAYVIGKNVNAAKGDVNVSVETAKNASYTFTAALSDSALTLGETETPTPNDGFVTEDGIGMGDMSITFSSLKLVYGAGAADTLKTDIVFTWDYTAPEGGGTNPNLVNQVNTDTTAKHGTMPIAGYWEYLTVPTTLSFDKSSATHEGGVYTIEMTNKVVTVPWGSFFEGKSPLNFYNSKYPTGGTVEDGDKILTEFEAMKTALNGKTITLTATLS